MFWNLLLILAGLCAGLFLFRRFPVLPKSDADFSPIKVSIIIPARNEAESLPLLLADLNRQTHRPFEIICVDDGSSDDTGGIASDLGATVIRVKDVPGGWTGKSWACQLGAQSAGGELLLFLDADVRLGETAVADLLGAYTQQGCTLSVLPYHRTEKPYEQLSFFFNLIQAAANGVAAGGEHHAGLYGPVILMDRQTYHEVGGHGSAKESIVDDVALGRALKKARKPYRLMTGGGELSYRMYPGGVRALLEGWTKNFAAGALNTPFLLLIGVFLWVASSIDTVLNIAAFSLSGDLVGVAVFVICYLLWVWQLRWAGRYLGSFSPFTAWCYPLYLAVFLGVFALSAFHKLFGLPVRWKGRTLKPRG